MNQTPRFLNRVLIGIFGLLLLLTGTLAVALAAVPAAGPWWRGVTDWARARLDLAFFRTTLPGQQDSWLWVVVALLALILLLLMVAWVAAQGKGRTGHLFSEYDADAAPGTVAVSAAVAENALRAALLERNDIVGASIGTYLFRGRACLKARVIPRRGVSPLLVARDVMDLVTALDEVIGRRIPVLISIGSGRRVRLGRDERVS